MADQDDVRRIALSLPEASEGDKGFGFGVRGKGFAWAWMERVAPKRPRVARDDVLAVRVVDAAEKEALLASDPDAFFSEPHYNGFPAVLVRLANVPLEQLEELLVDAWRVQAPRALVQAWESQRETPSPPTGSDGGAPSD
jgi:hypothetical protein